MIALLLALTAWAGVSEGAEAWDRGDAPAAIAAWEQVEGVPSGVILYDLGVAHYRMGDAPRAVAYFQAARRLRPRDPYLVHNLARARNQLEGEPVPVRPRQGWQEFATTGEVATLAFGLAAIAAAGLVQRRRMRPDALRLPWLVTGAAGLALALTAGAAVRDTVRHPVVVVVDAPAVARDADRADGVERFVLAPGSEVRVFGVRQDWLLIETGPGERGWIPRGSVLYVGPPSIVRPATG